VPPTPDVAKLVENYKGRNVQSTGESFDVSPLAIEARVQRPDPIEGLKLALLPKKTRGDAVHVHLTLRYGTAESLKGKVEAASFLSSLMLRGTKNLNHQQIQDALSLPSSFSGQMIIFCVFCLGFFAPVVVESSQHSHGDGRDGSHFTRRSAGWIPLFWTPRPGPRRNSPPPTFMTNAAPIDWCTWRPKSQHIRPGVFPNKPNPGTI